MISERAQVGWGFWFRWVLASTVGLAVGISVGIFVGIVWAFSELPAAGPEEAVFWAVFGAVAGASLGTAQWLVLRRHIFQAGWWVLASTVGGAVGEAVALAVVGASVGIAQRLTLWWWQVSRAGWWVLASTVGLPAAFAVGVAVDGAVGVAVGVAYYGAITGGVLVWLLRPLAQLLRPLAQMKAFESGVLTCPVCDSNRIINHRGIFRQLISAVVGASSDVDFTCKNCLFSWNRPARHERHPD